MRSMARFAQITSAKNVRSSLAAAGPGRSPGAGADALKSGVVGRAAETVLERHWKKMEVASAGMVTCTLARTVALDSPSFSSNASNSTSLLSAITFTPGGSLAFSGVTAPSHSATVRSADAAAGDGFGTPANTRQHSARVWAADQDRSGRITLQRAEVFW